MLIVNVRIMVIAFWVRWGIETCLGKVLRWWFKENYKFSLYLYWLYWCWRNYFREILFGEVEKYVVIVSVEIFVFVFYINRGFVKFNIGI